MWNVYGYDEEGARGIVSADHGNRAQAVRVAFDYLPELKYLEVESPQGKVESFTWTPDVSECNCSNPFCQV